MNDLKTWRCFHCDEVFSDAVAAGEHFGRSQRQEPACQIDIAKYRAMEERHRRACEEDTDTDRAMYRLQGEHRLALQREEEKGYARGLRDANHVEPADVARFRKDAECLDAIEHYSWAIGCGTDDNDATYFQIVNSRNGQFVVEAASDIRSALDQAIAFSKPAST